MSGKIFVDYTDKDTYLVRFTTDDNEPVDMYEVEADKFFASFDAVDKLLWERIQKGIRYGSGEIN
jgi:hypothetical protein